jgi:hypothetical protein
LKEFIVNMNIYWKKNLIWTFCVEMALWELEGGKFSQNIVIP